MKILELIQRTTEFFAQHDIEQPRLQIELLLAHLLKKKRLNLYLDFQQELQEPILERLRQMVRRRADGEPLQYIIGTVNFYGLELAVDKRAFIPRPETEILAETVLKRLGVAAAVSAAKSSEKAAVDPDRIGAGCGHYTGKLKILDLCTGCGAIALALARNLPQAKLIATDLSADALALARENAKRHGLSDRVECFQSDLYACLLPDAKFHVIVSNPPYIADGDREKLAREILEHEPSAALFAGPTGLEVIEKIIAQAPTFLLSSGLVAGATLPAEVGLLAVEIGQGQHGAVSEKMKLAGFRDIEVIKDLAGIDRIVIGKHHSTI